MIRCHGHDTWAGTVLKEYMEQEEFCELWASDGVMSSIKMACLESLSTMTRMAVKPVDEGSCISKPALPCPALSSTGQLSQNPSSPNKVPNCQNL